MAKSLDYERRSYGGKPVYVFEDHSVAILPWAEVRRERAAPVLLTLDYHTDTCSSFNRYAFAQFNDFDLGAERDKLRLGLLGGMDFRDRTTLLKVLPHLDHEEHISAAQFTDIIAAALVVSVRGQQHDRSREYDDYCMGRIRELPARTHRYPIPAGRMFHLNTQGYLEDHPEAALESPFLDEVVLESNDMLASLGKKPLFATDYILDVDLDYFRRHVALKPADAATFLKLLRGAVAITIAMEPRFVRKTRIDGDMEADTSLVALERLIESALGARD